MTESSNRKIARNTFYLYGRLLLSIGVSLYTVRVVLETLGVQNYGIYGVVGSIVTVFGFLNGTMAGATSRFLNFELGTENREKLHHTFSTALLIHLTIPAVLLVLGETLGLWFVNTRLEIAPERMVAANWTYQMSLLASVFTIVQIPYTAALMAHEKMDVFALIELLHVFLKFLILLPLIFFRQFDNLIFYSVLIALVSMTVFLCYRTYCVRHFPECQERPAVHHGLLKEMLSFSGWDIYGNLAHTLRAQGMIVILNRIGGTILNAAGTITMQVSGTLTSFASSLISAFRPQIIQNYAACDYSRMLSLINNCARYCFLLMGLFAVPMIIEMDYILRIWLVDPPAHTAVFCRLAIMAGCGELLNAVCAIGIHATGRVMRISFISGTLYLLELPMMYFLYRYTGDSNMVYVVHLVMIFVILLVNSSILKYQLRIFSISSFWLKGVLVPAIILVAVYLGAASIMPFMPDNFGRLVAVTALSTILLGIFSWFFATDAGTRRKLLAKIQSRLTRK